MYQILLKNGDIISSHHTIGIVHHSGRNYTATTKTVGNCDFAAAAAARAMLFCFGIHLKFSNYHGEENPYMLF